MFNLTLEFVQQVLKLNGQMLKFRQLMLKLSTLAVNWCDLAHFKIIKWSYHNNLINILLVKILLRKLI